MRIIESGHIYELEWLDGKPRSGQLVGDGSRKLDLKPMNENHLIFVNRELGTEHPGTQTQEVLRALIDRTMHCDNCLRWPGNDQIIYHLRMALVLHEARALERKTEKGDIVPELIRISDEDGHFMLEDRDLEVGNHSQDWDIYYHKLR